MSCTNLVSSDCVGEPVAAHTKQTERPVRVGLISPAFGGGNFTISGQSAVYDTELTQPFNFNSDLPARRLRETSHHRAVRNPANLKPATADRTATSRSAGFLRGGARPPLPVLIDYIAEHRDQFGVEPICRVLTEHGCPIAPSTYYDTIARRPSKRSVRDEELKAVIRAHRAANRFVAGLGAREMWLRLRGQGHDVARCTVERLMHEMGLQGVTRRRTPITTVPDPAAERPRDLVDRHFAASRPNQLWVADFTYCPTWTGMVYVAFVFDVFSRRILGWRAATSMRTELVLDCLEQAIWTRGKEGVRELSGLVHHTDAGSQYTSIAFTDRLLEVGIDPSVGSVGDAYDNALAESQIGLYKSELIWPHGPWRDRDHLEAATLDWVDWFNTERPHESVDDLTPVAAEELHYRYRASLAEAS